MTSIAEDRVAQIEAVADRLSDLDIARRLAEHHHERSVESIIEQFTITYPAPEPQNIPAWAEEVGEPSWEWGEKHWQRLLRWSRRYPEENGGGVEMTAYLVSTRTEQRVEGLEFYVNLMSIDTPEEARQVAAWLLEAAETVESAARAVTS